jgi:hypothetical protein
MAKKAASSSSRSGFGIPAVDEVSPPEPAEDAATDKRPRQDRRPVCPDHGVQMTARSTSAMYTYYRCPAQNCRQTQKLVRPIGPLKNLYGNGRSASPDP